MITFTRRPGPIPAQALMAPAEEVRELVLALEVIGGIGDRARPCGCLADPAVFGHGWHGKEKR